MKNNIKYFSQTTSFHRRDSWVIENSTGENISSFFNAVVDNEQQIIRFELKEKYLNSIDGVVIVKESGPDSLEEGEKLRQDELIALLGSQGNEFFAVVKLANE